MNAINCKCPRLQPAGQFLKEACRRPKRNDCQCFHKVTWNILILPCLSPLRPLRLNEALHRNCGNSTWPNVGVFQVDRFGSRECTCITSTTTVTTPTNINGVQRAIPMPPPLLLTMLLMVVTIAALLPVLLPLPSSASASPNVEVHGLSKEYLILIVEPSYDQCDRRQA